MQNINCVVLTGNLTRDPELRSTNGGTSVCSMRIAVNGRQKISGEWADQVNYFDVTVWGAHGENCERYLAKGRGVAVDGRLRWHEWTDKDGNKRQSVDVVANTVQFLGDGGSRDNGAAASNEDFTPAGASSEPPGGGSKPPGMDDDIPFAPSVI